MAISDSTGQVSVGTAVTGIVGEGGREVAILYNVGTVTCYLGATASVTTANGYPLLQDAYHPWFGPSGIYGVTAAGTADIRVHVTS